MSKKTRRKQGRQPESAQLTCERSRRELNKGNARQALKDARVLFRRDPGIAHRELLEDAYLARAEQLQRGGLLDEARAIYRELTSLGVQSHERQAKLATLQVRLGIPMAGSDANSLLASADPALLGTLADQAVRHPRQVPSTYADLKREADAVRQALQAIEQGEDAEATRLLQEIPRKSVFADWRLFARGLSAHYLADLPRRDTNWERLDPQRAPFRIAQALLRAHGVQPPPTGDDRASDDLPRPPQTVLQDPLVRQLRSLGESLSSHRWNQLLRGFLKFRMRYANSHGELIAKTTDILWRHLARQGYGRKLAELASFAPAPALDPHWNRARALCAEQDDDQDLGKVEQYWQAYRQDLEQVAGLRADERQIALGLVDLRLGRAFVESANWAEMNDEEDDEDLACEDSPLDDEVIVLRKRALHYLHSSRQTAPCLLASHQELAKLYLMADQPAKACQAYQTLLRHFPNDYPTLTWLAEHYLEQDRPADAACYVQQAARLRPRDVVTLRLEWNQRLATVRLCVRKRMFEAARRELELAAANPPPDAEPLWLDTIRATIEFKAQNQPAAQQYLDRARQQLPDATALWMLMRAQAARYGLSRELKNDFSARLKVAIEQPCSSQSAGHMAKFLATFLQQGTKYSGFVTHQRQLRSYLQRCQSVTWQRSDLRHVCDYLARDTRWHHGVPPLLRQLADQGCREFPQEPHFPYFAAVWEMSRGPFGCDMPRATQKFEEALRLTQGADTPLPERFVELAKSSLTMLHDLKQRCSLFGDDDETTMMSTTWGRRNGKSRMSTGQGMPDWVTSTRKRSWSICSRRCPHTWSRHWNAWHVR